MSTANELLRICRSELELLGDGTTKILIEAITDFLSAEKETDPFADSIPKGVLKWDPEAEPVGYVYTDFESGLKQGAIDDHSLENGTPLYTRPEPEADEPVAWIQPNHLDKAQFMPFLCRVEPKQRDDFIPLYTRPEPARKPMIKDEIARGFYSGRWLYEDFEAGVRWAEKHHGI